MDRQDELQRQELEAELQTEILPGTEIMRDVGDHHFIKTKEVLVPQPSSDRHDPLNWSWMWKTLAITAATTVTFTQGFGPLSLAPMFPDYIQEFDSNLNDVIAFTGNAILVLGFSNFIWVPLSTSIGRRPVLILSQIITLASTIWRAKADSYSSFMGACILNGIGAGPAESLQPAIIADMFFLHDRGWWNTFYWVFYMGSLMIGPIVGGSMALHVGWRNFWWLNTALVAASTMMVIFLFPETKYHRNSHREPIVIPSTSDSKENASKNDVEVDQASATEQLDPWLGKGSPSKAQWGLYTPSVDPLRSILLEVWVPWKLFAFPIVELAAFVVSWSCSFFLLLNLTQSRVFAAPPYNFNPETVGFMNFAVVIGAIIGLATAGPLSDWVSARATRKNGGIREPEMRLPAMIPYVLIMILGNFVVAYGYQYSLPWEAIVVVGYTCVGIQVAALPAITNTYAIDSYKPVAGSIMVAITVNKNVWGYGFSAFITPWVSQSGFVSPIMCNMALGVLWCLFGVLFYYKGKTFRRWTKNSNVHKME